MIPQTVTVLSHTLITVQCSLSILGLPWPSTTQTFWVVPPTEFTNMGELATLDMASPIIVEPTHPLATRCWPFAFVLLPPVRGWSGALFRPRPTHFLVQCHIHTRPGLLARGCHLLPECLVVLPPGWMFSLIEGLQDGQHVTHEAHCAARMVLCHCCRIAAKTLYPSDDVIDWPLAGLRDFKTREYHQLFRVCIHE